MQELKVIPRLHYELKGILDTMIEHLVTQGRPAMTDNGACHYRQYDGAMCAVGALIPDSLYDPHMENNGIGFVMDDFPELTAYLQSLAPSIYPGSLARFLQQVQMYHDGWSQFGRDAECCRTPNSLRSAVVRGIDAQLNAALEDADHNTGWFA